MFGSFSGKNIGCHGKIYLGLPFFKKGFIINLIEV
jgi:hypothetical protein